MVSSKKHMGYLEEVEKELRTLLISPTGPNPDVPWDDQVVSFVREKLLESYRNGMQAARRQPQSKSSQNQDKKSKAPK